MLVYWCFPDLSFEPWSEPPVVGVDGALAPATLAKLQGYHAVACSADDPVLRLIRQALSARKGAVLPLITENFAPQRYVCESHLCIDTTASGGNASLLESVES